MCGLFGWDWKRDKMPRREERVKLALALAMLNDERGGTSWGFAHPSETDVLVSRAMGHAVTGTSQMATFGTVMGHTRMPTRGAHTVENTHPFRFGTVIGAHNGMIYNWDKMEKKYPERASFEVDSMHLVAHLAEGKDVSELEGYGATTYIDTAVNNRRVFLARLTTGADLNIVSTEHGMIWSSSESHLDQALEAAGMEVKHTYKLKTHHLYCVEGGKLYEMENVERKLSDRTYTPSTSSGPSIFYGDMDEWRMDRDRRWREELEKYKAAGRELATPEMHMCRGAKCHGRLEKGECVIMADVTCSGSKNHMDKFVRANTAAASPATDTELVVYSTPDKDDEEWPELDEVVWNPDERPVGMMYTVDSQDRDDICMQTCNQCVAHLDRTPANYHPVNGGQYYRQCRAPSEMELTLFQMAVELAPETPILKRDGYRWRVLVDEEEWTWEIAVEAAQAVKPRQPKALGAATQTEVATKPGTNFAKVDG